MTCPGLPCQTRGGQGGTLAITAMMYWLTPLLIGMPMDIAGMLGGFLGVSQLTGMALHFANGMVIFPLIFTYVLYGVLPGGPAIKGTIWGVILWIIAQTVVMPMMGAGFFSADAGGMIAALASLLGHIVYGGLLGAIAGAPTPVSATA